MTHARLLLADYMKYVSWILVVTQPVIVKEILFGIQLVHLVKNHQFLTVLVTTIVRSPPLVSQMH